MSLLQFCQLCFFNGKFSRIRFARQYCSTQNFSTSGFYKTSQISNCPTLAYEIVNNQVLLARIDISVKQCRSGKTSEAISSGMADYIGLHYRLVYR